MERRERSHSPVRERAAHRSRSPSRPMAPSARRSARTAETYTDFMPVPSSSRSGTALEAQTGQPHPEWLARAAGQGDPHLVAGSAGGHGHRHRAVRPGHQRDRQRRRRWRRGRPGRCPAMTREQPRRRQSRDGRKVIPACGAGAVSSARPATAASRRSRRARGRRAASVPSSRVVGPDLGVGQRPRVDRAPGERGQHDLEPVPPAADTSRAARAVRRQRDDEDGVEVRRRLLPDHREPGRGQRPVGLLAAVDVAAGREGLAPLMNG